LGVFFCAAASGSEDPAVQVETSPVQPVRGSPWTVLILVDYPLPADVLVRPPELPPGLVLEQIRTEGRLVRSGAGTRRWTAVEFVFVPQTAGIFSLDPFEVVTPGGRIRTQALVCRVGWEAGVDRLYQPRLRWDAYPESVRPGEAAELALLLSGWDPRIPPPDPLPLQFPAPKQAVIEEVPRSGVDRERGVICRVRIIPLAAEDISMGITHVHYGGVTLEVPGVSIRVTAPAVLPAASPMTAAADTPAGAVASAFSPDAAGAAGTDAGSSAVPAGNALPFPEEGKGFFSRFRAYRDAAALARERWNQGREGEALAGLRRSERDDPLGFALTPLRREAEHTLGIVNSRDEPWYPRTLLAAPALGSLGLFFILGFRFFRPRFFKKSGVTPGFSRGYKSTALVFILLAGISLFGFAGRGINRLRGRAVLRHEGAVYQVPGGTAGTVFPAGQPVSARAEADSWVFVESPGGGSGWTPRDNIITY
jgi:hypothetical protein